MPYLKSSLYSFPLMFCICLLLSSCSNSSVNKETTAQNAAPNSPQKIDRYEGINRKIYSFNKALDKVVLKPTAKAYKRVTPEFVDIHIGNFFSNLGDVGNAINNTLQGKFGAAASDTERFIFNTTLGFAGLVDIASSIGIEKHNEDFGQTLAKWGVKSGPYVMLPFLGPSTVRDASAKLSVDRYTDPVHYSDEEIALFIVETVKKRADLISESEVIAGLSDDEYSALRDLWLQNREHLIRDGKADPDAASDMIDQLEMLDSL